MHLNNDYISRYRSVPAASHTEELSDAVIPYLPRLSDDPQLFQSTPMHYHPETELIYVEEGIWNYRCAASSAYRTASAGDLVLFPPYEPHESAIRAGCGGYRTHCICFDNDLLAALPAQEAAMLLQMLTASDNLLSLHIKREQDPHQMLHRTFSEMLDALNAPHHCEELLFYGALCMFFGYLQRIPELQSLSPHSYNSIDQRFARAIIDYSEQHYAEVISTFRAAESLSYSEPYFCRMFRRVFHMCYSEYINRLRISKVRPLLETMSVTDAAGACGFTHMSHFSKTFRRCTGMSPTEYRRMMTRDSQQLHRSENA